MNVERLAAFAGALFFVSAAPAAAQGWGAFALSQTGAFGWSSNYETKEGAEERALQECGKHAQDCVIRRVFQNECLAVALGRGRVGWAWGGTKDAREAKAIESCNRPGVDCTIRASFCSGSTDEGEPQQPSQPTPPSSQPTPGQPAPGGPKE